MDRYCTPAGSVVVIDALHSPESSHSSLESPGGNMLTNEFRRTSLALVASLVTSLGYGCTGKIGGGETGAGNSSGTGTGNSSGTGTGNSSGTGTGNSSGTGTGNSSGTGTGNSSGTG